MLYVLASVKNVTFSDDYIKWSGRCNPSSFHTHIGRLWWQIALSWYICNNHPIRRHVAAFRQGNQSGMQHKCAI